MEHSPLGPGARQVPYQEPCNQTGEKENVQTRKYLIVKEMSHTRSSLVPHRTACEHVEEPLEPHISVEQVPVTVWRQVDQKLLYEPAVLDFKWRHIRFWYNTGDLHQALHPSIHLKEQKTRHNQKTSQCEAGYMFEIFSFSYLFEYLTSNQNWYNQVKNKDSWQEKYSSLWRYCSI